MEKYKDKLAWLIVQLLPARVVLYAFCKVHGLLGEAPEVEGEYCRAWNAWVEKHQLIKGSNR